MSERPSSPIVRAIAGQAFRDGRTRTLGFCYLFAAYAFAQPSGYRSTYPSFADRVAFARGFGANVGLRLMYGRPYDLTSVGGYTAWRVGGVLAVVAAAFGVVAAVRALRAEEESGRTELVLAGAVTRRSLHLAVAAAVSGGVLALWVAEFAGLVLGGVDAGGAAYLALAAAAVAAVFAGVGAVTSQLAPTRRTALALATISVALAFALRVLSDTVTGLSWLSWATPLGWVEQLRPLTGARPAVLLLPAALTAVLILVTARLAAGRDVGTGLLPVRDAADPDGRLLASPGTFAVRTQLASLLIWMLVMSAFSFLLGTVSNSISTADVPKDVERQLAKFGAGSILTPIGYLGFVFVILVVAVCAYACVQVGGARQEEAAQQLETTLAQPVARSRWLLGRLAVAAVSLAAVSLVAGLAAWAGARAAGIHVALPRLIEAGANSLPPAILFLGIAALAYAALPRASSTIAYGLLAVAFLWQIVGSLLQPPRWLLDITPFAHVAAVPAKPFGATAAAVMLALGAAAAAAALARFRYRDLVAQ